MSEPDQQKAHVHAMYSARAKTYDESHGGWHVELGHDFVKWLDVQPGETALDLACGTGLVTIPLAEHIGPRGTVVGVDLTADMISKGQDKLQALDRADQLHQMAQIEWIIHDITSTSLVNVPSIKTIVEDRGGFDIISVCSALVLLPDATSAIKFWASSLLKQGGRMIIDVPTEALTSQFMFTYHIPVAIGHPPTFSQERLFVKNIHSLENLFEEAGLVVHRSIHTKSYIVVNWYKGDEEGAMEVFQKKGITQMSMIGAEKKVEEARKAWLELWPHVLSYKRTGEFGFQDGHWLYVTIGSKP